MRLRRRRPRGAAVAARASRCRPARAPPRPTPARWTSPPVCRSSRSRRAADPGPTGGARSRAARGSPPARRSGGSRRPSLAATSAAPGSVTGQRPRARARLVLQRTRVRPSVRRRPVDARRRRQAESCARIARGDGLAAGGGRSKSDAAFRGHRRHRRGARASGRRRDRRASPPTRGRSSRARCSSPSRGAAPTAAVRRARRARGAVAVVAERPSRRARRRCPGSGSPARAQALALAAANFYGDPAARLDPAAASPAPTARPPPPTWSRHAAAARERHRPDRHGQLPLGGQPARPAPHTTPERTALQALLAADARRRRAARGDGGRPRTRSPRSASRAALPRPRRSPTSPATTSTTTRTWRRTSTAKARLFPSACATGGVAVVNVDDALRRRALAGELRGRARGWRSRRAGARADVRCRASSTLDLNGIARRRSRRPRGESPCREPAGRRRTTSRTCWPRSGLALARRLPARRRRRAASAALAACPAGWSASTARPASRASSTTPTPTTRSRSVLGAPLRPLHPAG